MFKRGQSGSGAAALVLLIGGLILLYLLLVPPDLRDALLNDKPLPESSGTTTNVYGSQTNSNLPKSINKSVLSEVPGRIDYLKQSDVEHPLSAVNLYTTTNAQVIAKESTLYVKNGVFDKLFRNFTFSLDDVQNTENVLLSFSMQSGAGRLFIYLNNNLIFDGFPDAYTTIELDKDRLNAQNNILFGVSAVGWRFWTTNEFQLKDVKITGDITDISQQLSKNTFSVADAEKFNMEKATLRFFPDCTPSQVGRLKVNINNENVYNAIPDCNQVNIIEFSTDAISAGNNLVTFKTEKGFYSIYQILVKTELKKQVFPTYYFEMDKRLFNSVEEEETVKCGEIDGYCPNNCDEDYDKDCCFETGSNYWCDIATADEGDRCASIINSNQCSRCSSVYEDDNNEPAPLCEGACGDDSDGACPAGCSEDYDKDCCFEVSEYNYWCDDVPVYGINDVCKSSLSQAQCNDCAEGYETEKGSFTCEQEEKDFIAALRDDFDVVLTLKFLDDGEKKAAKVFVNGHKFSVSTAKEIYSRNIDDFVEEDSNVIKIEPESSSLDIRKLEVKVEKSK
ncbi:hypothetical protein J4232_04940 [Candidatus Woesearchaeota archaeon]|nr:hypothetical protein [Candidatus Woesearchaeota archaeon]